MLALLIQILIFLLIVGIVYRFVLPLLPPPFGQIAYIVLAVVVVIWLINVFTGALYAPLGFNGF